MVNGVALNWAASLSQTKSESGGGRVDGKNS